MATAPIFDPYGNQPHAEKKQRSWLSSCLVGCLVMTVVGIVIAGLVVYWVSQNWRGWASDLFTAGIEQAIEASELPPQEQQEVKQEVDRVIEAFRGGRLSGEQVELLAKRLMESPFLTMIVVSTVDAHYFEKSGLTNEEKVDGKVTLQRFVRGVVDGTIDKDSMDAAMAHVADRQGDGNWRLREQVTDEQLRNFLAAAKSKADEANIAAEPEAFDPSDEIKRIVDEALNEPINDEEPAKVQEPAEIETSIEHEEPAEAPLPQ
jgi:hypothetical protein